MEAVVRNIFPASDYCIRSVMDHDKSTLSYKTPKKKHADDQNNNKKPKKSKSAEPSVNINDNLKAKSKKAEKKQRRKDKKKENQKNDNDGIKQRRRESAILAPRPRRSFPEVDLRIAQDIKASNFTVVQGCIYYLSYKLESFRIPPIPKNVLDKIERTFTIVKDLSSSSREKSVLRFEFSPTSDLKVLLDEAKLVAAKLDNNIVDDHDIFPLPWKHVVFREGYMYLTHPNAKGRETIDPFRFNHHLIHKSYADFMPYFEKYATKLLVEGRNGRIIRLLNFDEFAKIFPHLTSHTSIDENEISITSISPILNRGYSAEEFRKSHFINKSPFLAYLCKRQLPNHKIYYLLESVVHKSTDIAYDEYGYLFSIKETLQFVILVYENINDESRSSLVFYVPKKDFEASVQFLAKFLASNEENKRIKLACDQIKFNHYVKHYDRIVHTTYEEWRYQINNLIY